jgi:hypothetical protein
VTQYVHAQTMCAAPLVQSSVGAAVEN